MLARSASKAVLDALADTPVVLIHGARQTGKSTLARSIADGKPAREYITLDDAPTLAAAAADPQGFILGLKGPVVIDEVQRVPDLFLAIKLAVDRDRTPGRFLLTGSANALLVPRVSESLAGRIQIIQLWPLSQGEIDGTPERFVDRALGESPLPRQPHPAAPGPPDLIGRIVRGGYPEPVSKSGAGRSTTWYGSYINTILQRDVRDLSNIESLTEMPRLLAMIAARTTGLLNFTDLASGMGIPLTTLRRYYALLEITFVAVRLHAWSAHPGMNLAKAPKVFLGDTGLACHLLSLDRARLSSNPNLLGPLLENFVALELLKQLSAKPTSTRLFHFRTTTGREVDFVLEEPNGRIVGIEVKSAASVGVADFNGLRTLAEFAGNRFHRGIILYNGESAVPFGKNLAAAPIHSLWTMP